MLRRRNFLGLGAAGIALAGPTKRHPIEIDGCGCAFAQVAHLGSDLFADVHSGLQITGLKIFGVSLTPSSDRPYVFVKLETNQGIVGWGEGTLEGKAGAVSQITRGATRTW